MNLTLHLIRKDLRALRMGFLLWTIFCLNHLVLRLLQLFYGDEVLSVKFRFTDRPDHLLLVYLPILLIPWLLHQDPLRGHLSFWKSIPISRRRLVTAKTILLLAFFVLLPLACETAYFTTAGLTRILPQALGAWAWRELPAIAAITLACAFTRTIWAGLIAASLGFAFIPSRIVPLLRSVPPPPPPPREHPLPEGVAMKLLDSNRKAYVYQMGHGQPDGKTKNLKHVTTSFQFQVSELPDDIVTDTPFAQDISYELNGKTHAEKTWGTNLTGLKPVGDRDQPFARKTDQSKPASQSLGWTFSMDHILETETTRIPLKCTIKVPLYRRIILKTSALAQGEFTRDGYNSLSLESFSAYKNQLSCQFQQRNIVIDKQKPDGTPYYNPFQTYCFWFRVPEYDMSFRYQYLNSHRIIQNYQSYPNNFATNNDTNITLDQTRQLECFFINHDTMQRSQSQGDRQYRKDSILGDFRSIKPVLSPNQWNVSLITYEKSGELSLPVEIMFEVLSPYADSVEPSTYNPDAPLLNEESAYSLVDKALAQPVMNRQEARVWLDRLATAMKYSANSYSNTLSDPKIENKIRHALLKVGSDNADLLFQFLGRSYYISRSYNTGQSLTPIPSDDFIARTNYSRTNYGYKFEHDDFFLEASLHLNPDQKDFYLTQLAPNIDLLDQMKIFGWDREALPKIIDYANQEAIPLTWQKYLLENPGEETNRALNNQIKRGVAPFWLVGKFLEKHPELAREVAEGFWENLVFNSNDLQTLSRAFAIAACNGVSTVPTDLKEILSMDLEKLAGGYTSKPKAATLDLQLSMIQSLALCSDCPMSFKEGSAWVKENAEALKFNSATKRYELPISTSTETPQTWGRWVNPIGNGKAVQKDGGIVLTAAGSASNWSTPLDGERSLPRILREVDGDFTLEADITPNLNPNGIPRYDDNRWQASGFTLFGDDSRQLFWEHAAGGKDRPFLKAGSIKGGKGFDWNLANEHWKPDQPTRLKLARKGNLFIRAWKQGAGNWQEISVEMHDGWPLKSQVGFFACNIISTPLTCHFSNITLTDSAEVPGVTFLPPLTKWKATPTPEGTVLPGWGTVENPVQAGAFSVNDGKLSLEVAPRYSDYNFQHNLYAPRALTKVKGDFTYEVTVESLDYQKHGWTSADVLAVDEATNHYLRGNVASRGGDAKAPVVFTTLYGTSGVNQPFIGTDHLPLDRTKPTRIRLQRRGPYFHMSFKQEGGEWFEFFPKAAPEWPEEIKVGILALNDVGEKDGFDPVTAVFSNPTLTTP